MDGNETATWIGTAILIAALFLFPKWLSFRHRAMWGAMSSVVGWAGLFIGLVLGDQPFMQSDAVALTWVSICGLAIILSITLLVPAFFEWLRKRRQPRRRTAKWSAGHWRR